MKRYLIIALFSSCSCFAQGYECNIEVVRNTADNVARLDKDGVLDFLMTFDESCQSDIEYLELSNNTLFKILQINPEPLLYQLENNKSEVKSELIFKSLETPMQDYNYKVMIDKLKMIKTNSKTKERVLSTLEELTH